MTPEPQWRPSASWARPPDGARLSRVETLKSDVFWFIWANFFSDTDVNRVA